MQRIDGRDDAGQDAFRIVTGENGQSPIRQVNFEDAYSVRCDATTTTQNDLDNGRVIAEVRFAPSHPVGLIVVTLSLREGAVTALDPTA